MTETRLVECVCGHLHAGACGGTDEVGRTCPCTAPTARTTGAREEERTEDPEERTAPLLRTSGTETADAPPPHGYRTEPGA